MPIQPLRRDRIGSVDGLRAVAVIGVVWAHVWAFSGNPIWSLGKLGSVTLDLNRVISTGGTGVDLFFVISGFCMFLLYSRVDDPSFGFNYLSLLAKRWMRVAPAFYFSAGACVIGIWYSTGHWRLFDLLSHLAFLHGVFPDTGGLAAPFWSLTTEWQFYMVLPLMVWLVRRFSFWSIIGGLLFLALCFRAFILLHHPAVESIWKPHLPFRLMEFCWGVCVARLYVNAVPPPHVLRGWHGFILSAAIMFLGRLLMVKEVLQRFELAEVVLKTIAEPILTLGYAMILWNVVGSQSPFQRLLSSYWMQLIGRWSYSIYLWHWWPSYWISLKVHSVFGSSVVGQHLAFGLTLALLLPISIISYRVLELPYLRKKQISPHSTA
jgi:peptidoglycan/LPS O-acetylase OafA/YrhL